MTHLTLDGSYFWIFGSDTRAAGRFFGCWLGRFSVRCFIGLIKYLGYTVTWPENWAPDNRRFGNSVRPPVCGAGAGSLREKALIAKTFRPNYRTPRLKETKFTDRYKD